ncbi:MAG TPA: GAF domain-containing protein [Gaiellaceae bacterium]|nr:GAF domain-containing protein [Gaiellaceae bacterium]
MDDSGRRQRALIDAGIALSSELELDAVLARLTEAAAELTGARYSALGVLNSSRTELERFFAHGIDEAGRAAIGDLPRGRGILGVLVADARPLRLHDLTADPRSAGFPAHHPPMHTFLGVPVLLRGVAYGNLYLAEKQAGDFTESDEELVTLLAAQAAVAIENARLYEAATRRSRQLESLNEIATALAREVELERLLDLVARDLRELLDARVVAVALPQNEGSLEVAASSDAALIGSQLGAFGRGARVLVTRHSELVQHDDEGVDDDGLVARVGARAGLIVPLVAGDRALGVIVVAGRAQGEERFGEDDLQLAEDYAKRAAVAVDASRRVERDALRRAVAAQELERARLARELHDETGQALTSILLTLRAIDDAETDEERRRAVSVVREQLVDTLQSVRRLAVELRPAALDDFGLQPALERLAATVGERSGLTVQVEALLGTDRLPTAVETAIYRIVQEALTNAVKHAEARQASVLLTRKNKRVTVIVEDDGRGFDPTAGTAGIGLVGMRERVQLLDGSLRVETGRGRGTTLVAELPLS